jgi:hypothetical protein
MRALIIFWCVFTIFSLIGMAGKLNEGKYPRLVKRETDVFSFVFAAIVLAVNAAVLAVSW